MRLHAVLAAVALLALSSLAADAEQSSTSEPILRATVDPPRVAVGQRTTLRIDVLAPNYMTAPPELPDFQLRNVVTRQLQSVNINEQRAVTTYAGVRFEFAIYPLEPGSYAIADQKIRIRYAAEPPATREAMLALPRMSFEAFIPDAAAGLNPFLSADHLGIEQTVQRSADPLKAGDALTRTVTITAEGTPAMLLPPQKFAAVEGLALYPSQPLLEDKVAGRTDMMTSRRVDSATYMLGRPGDYSLPAIDVSWWNVRDKKVEIAHLDGVTLNVAPNPTAEAVSPNGDADGNWTWSSLADVVAEHWRLVALGLMALAALGSMAPQALRSLAAWHRRRQQAYLQSEAWSFNRLRAVARRGDTKATYFALLDWLQRFKSVGSVGTIGCLKAAADDPVLDRQIDLLRSQLFAPGEQTTDWSPRRLIRHITSARRALGRQSIGGQWNPTSLPQLNPGRDHEPSHPYRRVAR
jgi:hypothetical protein